VDEDAAEVLGVLLDPVVPGRRPVLLQEADHVLLELAASLARDDLDHRSLLGDRLVKDPLQRLVDLIAVVVDVMQVQLQLHHPSLCSTSGKASGSFPPWPAAR
jgi:hypothetical protein